MGRVVFKLYGKQNCSSLVQARYAIFCTSTVSEKLLPPTDATQSQNALQANYQACIWQRALVKQIIAPNPSLHGWEEQLAGWTISWFPSDHVIPPPEVTKIVSCHCQKNRSKGRCSCKSASLLRTPLYACTVWMVKLQSQTLLKISMGIKISHSVKL